MTKFVIDSDIPAPAPRVRGAMQPLMDALAKLDVGESIFVAADICKAPGVYAARVGKAGGYQFVCRKAEKSGIVGHRIWRFA